MRTAVFVAAISLLQVSAPAIGQTPPPVVEGEEVRIWVPSNGLVARLATVDSIDETRLVLRIPRINFPLTVPIDSVARLQVRAPGRSALAGGLIGGFAGLAAGAAASLAVLGRTCSDDSTCELIFIGSPPAGLLVGTVLGVAMARVRWRDIRLRTP